MKNVIFALLFASFSISAQAVTVKETRAAGLLYAFLSTMEQPHNEDDGVLSVSSEIACTKYISQNQIVSDSYSCLAEVGGITGAIAETVYSQLPKKSEEHADGVTIRTGKATCIAIEQMGKATLFECM